ncbi:MAG: LTA synthase family protein [Gemmatimonadota bacterium]
MPVATLPDTGIAAAVVTSSSASWTRAWRTRCALLVRVLAFWMVWFALARLLFLGWHWALIPAGDRTLLPFAFVHGARMDLSAAAYLTALCWLVLLLTISARRTIVERALAVVSAVSVVFVSLVTLTDIGTFGPWRRRLDGSLWTYLQTPREAYASASSVAVTPLLVLLLLLVPLTWWLLRRSLRDTVRQLEPVRGVAAIGSGVALFVTGLLLAVPIRGGLQWTPLNESTVLFSRSTMANLGAQNAGWYLLYSTLAQQKEPTGNPYAVLPARDVSAAMDSLYRGQDVSPASLLTVARPNVILIIWESFTAKVVARLDGVPDVTPQFERWSHQGILFDSLFASGERSAQGLVSILSGFPSVPNEAIMARPRKAASLPQLGQSLRGAGYHTSYYYGGELAFANMKAYVLNGGFDRVTGVEAFPDAQRNSKWGAHDHVVLERALQEVSHEARPFFTTVFTLSSHEPFEVPEPPHFPGGDESTQFLNAHHYTDASIGRFLDSAAVQPWWDSTLVVIIADHGSPLPNGRAGTTRSVPDRHHIPMLWLGGALRVRDTVIHRIGASVDLAPTLLTQLGLRREGFRWGRNLLTTGQDGFAYFANNDGFAFIDGRGWLVFDERANRTVEQSPGAGASHRRNGSALLQASFADYLAR